MAPGVTPSAKPSATPSASPSATPSGNPKATPTGSPDAATGPAATLVDEPEIDDPIIIEKIVTDMSDISSSVKPGKVKVTKTSRSGKSLTVKVKKIKGVKYQVEYTTKKNSWKKAKKKTFSGTKTTIKNLKKNSTYYIRIRAFKKDGKKTVYGKWSKRRRV